MNETEKTQPASRRLRLLALSGMALGGLLALALWLSPAAQQLPWGGWRYSCPIYSLTGLLCMGCGATRALRSLLAGDLATALRQNGLFVILLAGAAWQGLAWLMQRPRVAGRLNRSPGQSPLRPSALRLSALRLSALRPVPMKPWLFRLLLGAALAFMVLRNLDLPVASLLRP